jgi:glycosyltransferase involved in cell wall biosynthesis
VHVFALGGTERIALRLARAWAERGRKVSILCGDPTGPLACLLPRSVELIAAEPPVPRGRGSRGKLGQALLRLLLARRFDVLFVPGNFHWALLPPLDALPADQRPAVIAQISAPLLRHGRRLLALSIFKVTARWRLARVSALVALSQETARDAESAFGRLTLRAIPLPALEDETPPLTRAQGRLVLCAGRLVPEKGFDVAIRAFARLGDPDAQLAIVGEGPERPRLEALIAELGLAGRVELTGYAPSIAPWLERARVLLVTSTFEGYAAVIVEALGAGRPVVATDCTPAARELLTAPGAGQVAPIGDVPALAQALRVVLSAPPADPQALAHLVDAYRIGPVSQAYLSLFDQVTCEAYA